MHLLKRLDQFSIADLSRFSGIKAHTIRIWEQRYGALTPGRSEGNTRFYDNSQLRRLLNIASLMELGHKVSKLCAMPDTDHFRLLKTHLDTDLSSELRITRILQLTSAALSFDEVLFEHILAHCLLRYGTKNTYTTIISPLLQRIGLMWAYDESPPAAEHFMSNLIRQKLCTVLDGLPPPHLQNDPWLLFLPENEFHETGLLYAQYLIRESGRKSLYLGCNTPLGTLENAKVAGPFSALLFFQVMRETPERINEYLLQLKKSFPDNRIFFAGHASMLEGLSIPANVFFLDSSENLERELNFV